MLEQHDSAGSELGPFSDIGYHSHCMVAASELERAGNDRLAEAEGFVTTHHTVDLYGLCSTCCRTGHTVPDTVRPLVIELYTESLGEPGSDADTYISMMATNAQLTADALGSCSRHSPTSACSSSGCSHSAS
jgi:hypothetical protein